MSDRTKRNLEIAVLTLGILGGGGAIAFLSFFLGLPAELQAHTDRIHQLEMNEKANRELLIRIEERLIVVQKELEKR
jgi:hypothetical protein